LNNLSYQARGKLGVREVGLGYELTESKQDVLVALIVTPSGNEVDLHNLLN
jgi:hypothetical protein